MSVDATSLGERVTDLRIRRGLSQRELAAEVSRSESWVSQVERGVLRVERLPMLQALADALGVAVKDLRPDASTTTRPGQDEETISDLDALRLTVTGHPAPNLLLSPPTADAVDVDVDSLSTRIAEAWQLTHASAFREANANLTKLLPDLEHALRQAKAAQRPQVARLLADAYQAAASAFARLDEADAAWVAADRSISIAEAGGDPLGAISGLFRMTHAFITLHRLEQAEHAAATGLAALADTIGRHDAAPEQLSIYGALQLVTAVVHARAGQRVKARAAIDEARRIALRIGEDRNDYETEFGPTNVNLHAIAVSVELGDAGEALDIAATVDASHLSTERQSRLYIDIARAHAQRRHFGEAIHAMLQAEELAPEQVHTHALARQLIRDLLVFTGRRAPEELIELAKRSATLA